MSRMVSMGSILGMNNRLPATRMQVTLPNRATASWLRVATNIDLTPSGYLRRRQGFARSAAGNFHSLWADDLDAYAVRDGDLIRIDQRTLAQTVLLPAVGHEPVCFARLPDGMVYWSNNSRIGRLAGIEVRDVVTPTPNPAPIAYATTGGLPPGRYQVCFTNVGPDGESPSTEPLDFQLPHGGGIAITGLNGSTCVYATGPDGEVFNEIAPGSYLSLGNTGAACGTFMLGTMPAGQAIAHHLGSLLVARGRFLYISEPYRYGLLNVGRSFIPFPADITVVQPCEDGLYVCADKTYWIPGDPLNTTPVVVLPYGALLGSAVFDRREQTAYWQGPQGVVIAKPGGQVAVPQDEALTFASAASGATLVREQLGDKHLITSRFDVETI